MRCVIVLSLLTLATAVLTEPQDEDRVRIKRLSDEVSMASLQTLIENQASLIQKLQADFRSLQSKLEAKTKAVAFSARIAASHGSGDVGVSLGLHQTVIFDEAITNVGHAYSVNNGIFTAPVAGTYAFFLSQMAPNSNHGDLYLIITKNGAVLDEVFAEGRTDANDQGTSQVTTHMAAGDQVWVRQEHGDAVRTGYWTIFTGYLLQAD